MKLIFGVLVILLGVASSVYVSEQPLPDAVQDLIHKLHENCKKTSGVDPETLKKVEDEDLKFPETVEWKNHAVCMLKRLGFINDDGKIVLDALLTGVKRVISEEKAKGIAQKCNVQKETLEDTSYWLGRCIHAELKPSDANGFF